MLTALSLNRHFDISIEQTSLLITLSDLNIDFHEVFLSGLQIIWRGQCCCLVLVWLRAVFFTGKIIELEHFDSDIGLHVYIMGFVDFRNRAFTKHLKQFLAAV